MNLLQRLGQAVGTAILAVVLASHLQSPAAVRRAEHVAAAFGDTFVWPVAMATLALIPAAALAVGDRGGRGMPRSSERSRWTLPGTAANERSLGHHRRPSVGPAG